MLLAAGRAELFQHSVFALRSLWAEGVVEGELTDLREHVVDLLIIHSAFYVIMNCIKCNALSFNVFLCESVVL